MSGEQVFTFPAYYPAIFITPGWEGFSPYCTIAVPVTVIKGSYDIYAKLVEPNLVSEVVHDHVVVIGTQGLEFRNFSIAEFAVPRNVTRDQVLNVPVSFEYRVGENVNVMVSVYLYQLGQRVLENDIEVGLMKAPDWVAKSVTVPITMIPESAGGVKDGTYGLGAEIEGYSEETQTNIDNCVIVAGVSKSVLETVAPVIPLIMVMGMLTPLMR